MQKYILVTGGAGYIGSHTVVELIQHGHKVVIVDNLVNSSYAAVARIEFIVKQPVPFFNVDISNYDALLKVFLAYPISGVIHFAALKAVGESTKIPLEYYENNVGGTLSLLKAMKKAGIKTFVFSSSATVYGDATRFENMIPIPEHCPNDPTNPYGKTKYVIENILHDSYNADNEWRTAILRYFNPIGAHPSGLIGEDPLGIPNNLLPYLSQVAIGRREKLSVFGKDYKTHDGTPIRDYIHVVDLARGHIAALNYLNSLEKDGGLYREWNLGTGKGSTVFDVYNAFCKCVDQELPYEVVGRRAGDVVNLTANPTRANTELKWLAKFTIDDACRDLWKWTTENPFGYAIKNYKWTLFGDEDDFHNRKHSVALPDYFVVSILNYGATIQSIKWKGQELVLGFDTLKEYKQPSNPYYGATIGRVANRITKGSFSLDGKAYNVSQNEGSTCLHGGLNGFDKNYFLGPIVKLNQKGDITMDFVYVEKDGNDGFPGDLVTYLKYTIDKSSISIEFECSLDETSLANATPVNVTNHSYFSVSNPLSIDGTVVKSITNEYLDVDKLMLPTGKVSKFADSLLSGLKLTGKDSYDNCFVVDKKGWALDTRGQELKLVFEVTNPETSVGIKFYTTEPSFQFYTGDGMQPAGIEPRSGFCMEPGRYTDAINNKEWSSQVILRKGETYGSKIKYSFILIDASI